MPPFLLTQVTFMFRMLVTMLNHLIVASSLIAADKALFYVVKIAASEASGATSSRVFSNSSATL